MIIFVFSVPKRPFIKPQSVELQYLIFEKSNKVENEKKI